jgi:hypothetical protein
VRVAIAALLAGLGAHAGLEAWLATREVAPVLLADPGRDPAALLGLGALLALRAGLLVVLPATLAAGFGSGLWRTGERSLRYLSGDGRADARGVPRDDAAREAAQDR